MQDVTDGSNVPLTVNTTLSISVTDVDDKNPAFNATDYKANITEGMSSGVLAVSPVIDAYDQDLSIGEDIIYSCKYSACYLENKGTVFKGRDLIMGATII